MSDDMFFSADSRSLRRGKRVAQRTPTCRPCLVWPADAPEIAVQGVILNINPFGMLIRMLETLPSAMDIRIQLMRDEDFQQPLAPPVEGTIVRQVTTEDGFVDHGVRLSQKKTQVESVRRIQYTPPRESPRPAAPKMHTLDITVGDTIERRPRR